MLALVVTQLTASGRAEAQLTSNLRMAASLESAANAAIAEGVFHALDTSEDHWLADGAMHIVRLPTSTVEVQITNEAGKVALNSASSGLISALLHAVGVDMQTAAILSAAIIEWRSVNTQGRSKIQANAYLAARRDYGPPGAPFQSLQELGLVLGMTPELLARLAPHLTIFHEDEPDFRLADLFVRQAVREAGGDIPIMSPSMPEENVIMITATAAGPANVHFVQRAVVKLGVQPLGELYKVLTWDTGEE